MAFSLFGKKPSKTTTPLVRKVEERQRAMREKAQAEQRPQEPQAPSELPPAELPALELDENLDFTRPPTGIEVSSGRGRSVPPAARGSASTIPASAKRGAPDPVKGPVDSILCIEVEGIGEEIPEPIEQAAVLFANGQAEEALERLKATLENEDLSLWRLQAWLMIFDLLQHLGKREEFEELALDFALKLERSPPIWVEAPAVAPKHAAPSANIALTGTLGAQSGPAFAKLRKASQKQSRLKLDFAKLQAVEPEGASLLLDMLRYLRTAKKEVVMAGGEQLLRLVRASAKSGDKSVDQAVWLLLLEVYQQLGLETEFDDAAIDFAVTYEVSPPSFDAKAVKAKTAPAEVAAPGVAATEAESDDAFYISGDVAGQSDHLFADLVAYAALVSPVVIDMSSTSRIDFVNAGRMLNTLEKLKAEGTPILLRGVREMVVALFAVMGIPRVARIIPRK